MLNTGIRLETGAAAAAKATSRARERKLSQNNNHHFQTGDSLVGWGRSINQEYNMAEAAVPSGSIESTTHPEGHNRWVRVCHWIVVLAFFTLAVTGILILMVHPRLYWGEVGNNLTPALLEIPISNNHRPDELQQTVTFTELAGAPVSADRDYPIFNQNGWGRSLHFLAAWFLVTVGAFYAIAGIVSGHIWRDLFPRARELRPRAIWQDLKGHLRLQFQSDGRGPPYGLLQRLAYTGVVFIALPLMLITGLTMSPAVTAAYPFLLDLFGGYQSARTVHFFGFTALVLFLVAHVAMVILTGFRRQIRAMTLGN
jgi:thiosulfate reductase cytochrome b subunit